jgi:hypothetical protein
MSILLFLYMYLKWNKMFRKYFVKILKFGLLDIEQLHKEIDKLSNDELKKLQETAKMSQSRFPNKLVLNTIVEEYRKRDCCKDKNRY